jgi:hypothetical protein
LHILVQRKETAMATITSPTSRIGSALQEREQQISQQIQEMNPERWTALVGGGALALLGLRRGGLSGLGARPAGRQPGV